MSTSFLKDEMRVGDLNRYERKKQRLVGSLRLAKKV